jgi:excisionase family DNA binding protein
MTGPATLDEALRAVMRDILREELPALLEKVLKKHRVEQHNNEARSAATEDKLLSVDEVAARLGVSKPTVRRWIQKGELTESSTMGSVYKRGQKLWIRFKGPDGKWTQSKTDYRVGQERQARKLLEKVEARIAAGAELGEAEKGPITVARYAEGWIEERKKLGVDDWENDAARLKNHVLPKIGDMRLDTVRPRHIAELFKSIRMAGKHAPKTIYNIYSVVKALFRDAHLGDLIDASPCILTKYQLGENTDKDPEWRATAIYTRDEFERFISDERIPVDRQVLYALEGIAALRHGEAAGLRWKHYDTSAEPLGRLIIATSYNKGRTKTKRTRFMPVHPTLAAILADWKLRGWPEMMGRQPKAEARASARGAAANMQDFSVAPATVHERDGSLQTASTEDALAHRRPPRRAPPLLRGPSTPAARRRMAHPA